MSKTLWIILFLSLESVVFFLYICRGTSTNQRKKCKTNPIFPDFSTKNNDSTEKQTQFKANSNPILAQKQGSIMRTNPIQSQSCPRLVLTLLFCRGSNPKTNLSIVYPELVLGCCLPASLPGKCYPHGSQQGNWCLLAFLLGRYETAEELLQSQ